MKLLFTSPLLITWLIAFVAFTIYSLPKFIKKNTMEYKLLLISFSIFLFSSVFLVIHSFAPQVLIIPNKAIEFLSIFSNVAIFVVFSIIFMLPGTIAKFTNKKAITTLLGNVIFLIILIFLLLS